MAARSGLPVILTIDVDGGLQLKQRFSRVTLIFVEPPSEQELRRRLEGRSRDDETSVELRLARAREERAIGSRYDYRVVNDDLGEAVAEIAAIMAERYDAEDKTIPDA